MEFYEYICLMLSSFNNLIVALVVYIPVTEACNEKLTAAYNHCLQGVVDFRSYHVQIVTKYARASSLE